MTLGKSEHGSTSSRRTRLLVLACRDALAIPPSLVGSRLLREEVRGIGSWLLGLLEPSTTLCLTHLFRSILVTPIFKSIGRPPPSNYDGPHDYRNSAILPIYRLLAGEASLVTYAVCLRLRAAIQRLETSTCHVDRVSMSVA